MSSCDALPAALSARIDILSEALEIPGDHECKRVTQQQKKPSAFYSRVPASLKINGKANPFQQKILGFFLHFLNKENRPIFYYVTQPEKPLDRVRRARQDIVMDIEDSLLERVAPDWEGDAASLIKAKEVDSLWDLAAPLMDEEERRKFKERAQERVLRRWRFIGKRWMKKREAAADGTNLADMLGFSAWDTASVFKKAMMVRIEYQEMQALIACGIDPLSLTTKERPFLEVRVRSRATTYLTVHPQRMREWAAAHEVEDLFCQHYPNVLKGSLQAMRNFPDSFMQNWFRSSDIRVRQFLQKMVARDARLADLINPVIERLIAGETFSAFSSTENSSDSAGKLGHTTCPTSIQNYSPSILPSVDISGEISPSVRIEKEERRPGSADVPSSDSAAAFPSLPETAGEVEPEVETEPARAETETPEKAVPALPDLDEVGEPVQDETEELPEPMPGNPLYPLIAIPLGFTREELIRDMENKMHPACIRQKATMAYGRWEVKMIVRRIHVDPRSPNFPAAGPRELIEKANDNFSFNDLRLITELKDLFAMCGFSRHEYRWVTWTLGNTLARPEQLLPPQWFNRFKRIVRKLRRKNASLLERGSQLAARDSRICVTWAYSLRGDVLRGWHKPDAERAVQLALRGFDLERCCKPFMPRDDWRRPSQLALLNTKAGSFLSSYVVQGLFGIETEQNEHTPLTHFECLQGFLEDRHAHLWTAPMRASHGGLPNIHAEYARDARLSELVKDTFALSTSFENFRKLVMQRSFNMMDIEKVCPFAAQILRDIATLGTDRTFEDPVPLIHVPPRLARQLAEMVGNTLPLASLVEYYVYPCILWDRYVALRERAHNDPEHQGKFYHMVKAGQVKLFEWLMTDILRFESPYVRHDYDVASIIQHKVQHAARQTCAPGVLNRLLEDENLDSTLRDIIERLNPEDEDCWMRSDAGEMQIALHSKHVYEQVGWLIERLPWMYFVFEALYGTDELDKFFSRDRWESLLSNWHIVFSRRANSIFDAATEGFKVSMK